MRRSQVSQDLAERSADPSVAIEGRTGGEVYERGKALEQRIRDETGQPYNMTVGMTTADPLALGMERLAAQNPETMAKIQKDNEARSKVTQMFAERLMEIVGSNPERLGKSEVGTRLVGALNRHGKQLRKTRTDAAKPYYDMVERSGTKIDITNTRAELEHLLGKERFFPSKLKGKLKGHIKELTSKIEIDGETVERPINSLSISELQDMRSMWSEVLAGQRTLADDIGVARQQRIARRVLAKIDQDLAWAADNLPPGNAATALAEANRLWAENSKPIDEFADKNVNKILKAELGGDPEKAYEYFEKLGTKKRLQTMRMIEKVSPETAADIR